MGSTKAGISMDDFLEWVTSVLRSEHQEMASCEDLNKDFFQSSATIMKVLREEQV